MTNLQDYNTDKGEAPVSGSLRWALEQETGPRIVTFRAGGTIILENGLTLEGESGSYVTVAGQTAPGDGIQLAGYGITVYRGAHDVVIRHLRIRPGVTPLDTWTDPDGAGPLPPYLDKWNNSALMVYGPNGNTVSNVIVDHCSVEWAIDENADVWDAAEKITFQYCIFGEGSTFGHYGHPESYPYSHSCGFLAGAEISSASDQYLTLHHNLFINNDDRNALLTTNGCTIEFVNNLVYNCGFPTQIYRTPGIPVQVGPHVNLIGNRLIAGPNDGGRRMALLILATGSGKDPVDDESIYVRDNFDAFRNDATMDDSEVLWARGYTARIPSDPVYSMLLAKRRPDPWPSSSLSPEPASSVPASLAAKVGANLPRLDPVDTRLVQEIANGTGRIGFGPQTNYDQHPFLANGTPPVDSDGDGMPDDWETAHGLNPNDPSDGPVDSVGDGYTNVEKYLNSLAGEN